MNLLIDKFTEVWTETMPFFDNLFVVAFLILVFTYASYTDLMEYKIYDKFNLGVMALRILFATLPVGALPITLDSYIGGIVGGLVLLIPAVVFLQKMGGDIKFMVVMGLYLGTGLTIFVLLLGCIYMLLFSLIRKIKTKQKVKRLKTPMAPFFACAFFTLFLISLI